MIKSKIHINNFLFLCITALILIFNPTSILSNNVSISNVSLVEQDVSAGANNAANFAIIQFDISWNNSWRTSSAPNNWDAVWVFAKYRVGSGAWTHCYLNNTGHTAPTGSTIDVGLVTPGSAFHATTNPGVGVFIYRNADGSGTFSLTDAEIRWNYGANGVLDDDSTEIELYAIEMVYVPQGSFALGASSQGYFYKHPTTTRVFDITSEGAISCGNTVDSMLYANNPGGGSTPGILSGTSPAAFPKGYDDFYCMKYEINQGQYRDFLNSLTYTQQATRTLAAVPPNSSAGSGVLSSTNANRNGLDIKTPGVSTTTPAVYACNLDGDANYDETVDGDGQYLACNFLSFADLKAYLDWSGLRPMTEFEFEKACRGPSASVSNEYAWGTANIAASQYTLNNAGTANEDIATNYNTTANTGNAAYGTTSPAAPNYGPLRSGIFAGNASNVDRYTSGATYYGIMEMSGGPWEYAVNYTQTTYTGTHGNGALSAAGNADATNWPTNGGIRGGDWSSGNVARLRVSDRYYAGTANSTGRSNWGGGRGVRTAP